ncbi:MAG: T9SS type A sorting domain-containing protein [Crocinitomicaceae bacterium]|nr:T9SS type A sorting domain-containing protein [Crocinitomicaceae bacterium]
MTTKNYYLRMGLLLVTFVLSTVGFSQTYTFTTATATGNVGPTQGMADAEYTATSLAGLVTVTGGIQYWVVPTTGMYSIEAFGGQGYGPFGGRGAHMYGEFMLTAGTTIKVLVGQQAGHYFDWPNTGYNNQYGGGGGSFVTDNANTPYVVAGGGGGNHVAAFSITCDGQLTTAGAAGTIGSIIGAGGTAGSGGTDASSADGGGGLLGNGLGIAGGQAYVNGGLGGIDEGTGGFGCGGGTSSWNNVRAGGGGGYSGGGAANNGASGFATGGGGGSFNSGTSPVNIAGVQLGDGMIVISNLCAPTVGTLIADVASLPDFLEDCIATPTAPTASNNCSGGIVGTPDVSFPITTIGTTVVTWTYIDGTNTVTQTQNVIISGLDVTPPVINSPTLADMGGQCQFTPPTPTATDICAGLIQGVADVTFPYSGQGLTVITWTYDDGNGNSTTQTQNITLNDVAPPALDSAVLLDYTGCYSATPPTPTATDYCAGVLNGTPDVSFPLTAPGPTTVTWTYDDGNGNVITQTQDVYVVANNTGVTLTGATITANGSGFLYQWIDCDTDQDIVGETNQSFTATDVTGNYAVVISDGLCSDTSACTVIDFSGVGELNYNPINIYPNPTNSGVFSVDFDGVIDQILVIDALGRTIEIPTNTVSGKVDGSSLATGKYTVRVITNDMVYTKDVMILR